MSQRSARRMRRTGARTPFPDRGYKRTPAILLRIANLNDLPSSPDQEFLDRLIIDLRGQDGAAFAGEVKANDFIVIADGGTARMLYAFANKDGERVVLSYQTVDMADAAGGRLPEGYDVLAQKELASSAAARWDRRSPRASPVAAWPDLFSLMKTF